MNVKLQSLPEKALFGLTGLLVAFLAIQAIRFDPGDPGAPGRLIPHLPAEPAISRPFAIVTLPLPDKLTDPFAPDADALRRPRRWEWTARTPVRSAGSANARPSAASASSSGGGERVEYERVSFANRPLPERAAAPIQEETPPEPEPDPFDFSEAGVFFATSLRTDGVWVAKVRLNGWSGLDYIDLTEGMDWRHTAPGETEALAFHVMGIGNEWMRLRLPDGREQTFWLSQTGETASPGAAGRQTGPGAPGARVNGPAQSTAPPAPAASRQPPAAQRPPAARNANRNAPPGNSRAPTGRGGGAPSRSPRGAETGASAARAR